jgi:hypothetical protein
MYETLANHTTLSDNQRVVHTLSIEDMSYPVELVELSIDKFDTTVDPLQLPKVSHLLPTSTVSIDIYTETFFISLKQCQCCHLGYSKGGWKPYLF